MDDEREFIIEQGGWTDLRTGVEYDGWEDVVFSLEADPECDPNASG